MARDFKALKRTYTISVCDGPTEGPDAAPVVPLRFRKRGWARIVDDIAEVPLFGEAIGKAIDNAVGGTSISKTAAAFTDAVKQAAEDEGVPIAQAAKDLLMSLPRVAQDIICADVILEVGEDPEDFRDWLRSLGGGALKTIAVGWVDANVQEMKGPLLRAGAMALSQLQDLAKKNGLTGTPGPADAVAPTPAEQPPQPHPEPEWETVAEPLTEAAA